MHKEMKFYSKGSNFVKRKHKPIYKIGKQKKGNLQKLKRFKISIKVKWYSTCIYWNKKKNNRKGMEFDRVEKFEVPRECTESEAHAGEFDSGGENHGQRSVFVLSRERERENEIVVRER